MRLVRMAQYKKDLDSYSDSQSLTVLGSLSQKRNFSSVGENFLGPGLAECGASLHCNHIETVPFSCLLVLVL